MRDAAGVLNLEPEHLAGLSHDHGVAVFPLLHVDIDDGIHLQALFGQFAVDLGGRALGDDRQAFFDAAATVAALGLFHHARHAFLGMIVIFFLFGMARLFLLHLHLHARHAFRFHSRHAFRRHAAHALHRHFKLYGVLFRHLEDFMADVIGHGDLTRRRDESFRLEPG